MCAPSRRAARIRWDDSQPPQAWACSTRPRVSGSAKAAIKNTRVSHHREDRDRIGKRRRRRERPDQERKQRADAAAEIVAEALARAAQPRRIEFGQERADAGEITGGEEAKREAEQPQDFVGQRQLRIEQHPAIAPIEKVRNRLRRPIRSASQAPTR